MSYKDFVADYNNMNLTAHDVRRINNLNSKQYTNLRNRALNNGDIPEVRHMNQTTAKFYTKGNDGYYHVQKTINGKKIYAGRFPNEETAKLIVDACKSVDWDLTQISQLIEDKKCGVKNYSIVNGYYVIQKSVNGANKVFATIRTDMVDEFTVKKIVNRFRLSGWNETLKFSILSEFGLK